MDNETPSVSSGTGIGTNTETGMGTGRGANRGTGIGTGIAKVLDSVYKELEGNEAVGTDLDDLFWSSINASAASSTADSLESTFYQSIVEDEEWSPKLQEISTYDPPSGAPVLPADAVVETVGSTVANSAAGTAVGAAAGTVAGIAAGIAADPSTFNRDAVINQVAESALQEVEKRIHRSGATPDSEGDYLLFSNGENGVYVGRPEQYGTLYDDPRIHMKDLLSRFYRGNKQELEQVAKQIIDNAVKGTPVDVKRWLGGK